MRLWFQKRSFDSWNENLILETKLWFQKLSFNFLNEASIQEMKLWFWKRTLYLAEKRINQNGVNICNKNQLLRPICIDNLSLHRKWNFSLTIYSVNVTNSADSCGTDHTYWRNLQWKTSFFCAVIYVEMCFDMYWAFFQTDRKQNWLIFVNE